MITRRAVVSSVVAPVALIGGWSLAAAIQPAGYSSVRDTISALAAVGTPHRWVMSLGFVILGLSHLVTASGLPEATRPGRITLAIGGVASAVLAAVPLPAHGSSGGHVLVAGFAFGALGLWPALAGRRGSGSGSGSSRSTGAAGAAVRRTRLGVALDPGFCLPARADRESRPL